MRSYSDLLGKVYVEGDYDCYGLLRRYYKRMYDLELRNYARPNGFGYNGLNLITDNFDLEGFEVTSDALQIGDGIIMGIARSPMANHVAVYVGRGMILHHLYNTKSCEESFDASWKRRVLNIVRHPKVTEQNKLTPFEIVRVTPPYVAPR